MMISWWLMIRFGSSHWLGVDGSQPLRRPIRSYPVHRRGRNVWRSSSAASSRVALDFGIYRDWYKEYPKTAKRNTMSWWSHESPRIQWIMTYHDASSRIQFFFPGTLPDWWRMFCYARTSNSDCDWPRLSALVTTAGGSFKDLGADLFQSTWDWLSFANQNLWDLP